MDIADSLIEIMRKTAKKEAKQHEAGIVYGKVTHVNPLRIMVNNSYEIGENFMVVSPWCKHTVIKIPTNDVLKHDHEIVSALNDVQGVTSAGPVTFIPANIEIPTDPQTGLPDMDKMSEIGGGSVLSLNHDHGGHTVKALPEILLWRGLKVGDMVQIIRFQSGSVHWVIGRVEGMTNEGQVDSDFNIVGNEEEQS